jgi:hypothetical protein
MKLDVTKEWCINAAKREGNFSVGAYSPEIAERAKELARARGHKNLDELIVCSDGTRREVWTFYIDGAACNAPDITSGAK